MPVAYFWVGMKLGYVRSDADPDAIIDLLYAPIYTPEIFESFYKDYRKAHQGSRKRETALSSDLDYRSNTGD